MAQQEKVQEKSETATREEGIVAFWKENAIFEKSLRKDAPQGEFVFYDGPPFATGLPHYGSLLSSIIKDVIPRYKTMRGFRVPRRWGWDCHGLPIESLIEKRLGLKTKKDIETIGVEAFNEAARASVLEFEREWEKYVERIGRSVDFKHSYKTMDNSYIESVWFALKRLHEKELLYEGRKVLMYCPHCETPLAKAEIAMDNTYKDVTDETAIVKFKLKDPSALGLSGDVYMLAWTTTPWTLPGNMALAVGEDIEYVAAPVDNGFLVVARELAGMVLAPGEPIVDLSAAKIFHGKDLVGLEYEPLYMLAGAEKSETAHRVYAADFVTTTDGTGIVHVAPMYGEDDFALGQKEKLPMIQMLDNSGHYNESAQESLRGMFYKKGEKYVMQDLGDRGLIFSTTPHQHSYPHCYRCGERLIYNAVSSWFINIQNIKARLLEENEKVRWVPEHLKHGRFKHIVENAPDWTISRNRFWASPLPIWKEKGGSRYKVVGSLDELKELSVKSGNRYFLARHGESTYMDKGIYTADPKSEYGLTARGEEQVRASAKSIPHDGSIVIISSPVRRARESAALIARELGVDEKDIVIDARLSEFDFGEYDGKPKTDWIHTLERPDWYTTQPDHGESFEMAKIRFGSALYSYEETYRDKTVVMVSHAVAFKSMAAVCAGARGDHIQELVHLVVAPGTIEELAFVPLPHNAKFELDLHRPYTDSIVLEGDDGARYERIPEVVDCWVESGSMPFAQYHYPFENEKEFETHAPGDFVAEYIAQTRTWFYYMHAMSAALFDRLSFRNVVSTGTLLAADGSKMSKSKGNYTDPLLLLDRYGADALRLYLMGSVVMQSEDVAFRDDDVREAHNRTIGILWNSYKFFELYASEYEGTAASADSRNPLDRWIRSRAGELIREMTDALDAYDTPRAVRPLRAFVEDYSTWFVRRSRERTRAGADDSDKQYALATQRDVLLVLCKLIAPIMPFIAESIYRGLRRDGDAESVHLTAWPDDIAVDDSIIADMAAVRSIASRALQLREEAGIKVRQPLALLKVRELPEDGMLRDIIASEVNVKMLETDPSMEEDVWLDTGITDELREEGFLRDLARLIQDARKKEGFAMGDTPALGIETDEENLTFFEKNRAALMAQTGLRSLDVMQGVNLPIHPSLSIPLALTLTR